MITNNETLATKALQSMKTVIDPEIGLNVVDLGLIYQVDFDESIQKIFIAMTLTSRFCPMGASIIDNIIHALKQTFEGWEVLVDLVYEPRWTSEMISKEGKEFLDK